MPREGRKRKRRGGPPARARAATLPARAPGSICAIVLATAIGGGCATTRPRTVVAEGSAREGTRHKRPARRCDHRDWPVPEGMEGITVDPELSCRARRKLIASLEIAQVALRREPGCRAMFRELGTDGISVLRSSAFIGASIHDEHAVCRHANAFSAVGALWTRLCRSFAFLSDVDGAVVVLHESLHHAGLGEWPSDLNGDRSIAISARVASKCRLDSGQYRHDH